MESAALQREFSINARVLESKTKTCSACHIATPATKTAKKELGKSEPE